ncbi:hypothetical protein ACO2J1_14475 [Leptospira interrogans]|uniref:Uncharacterized protein n=1 Tax=Leptospira interrogans serovar Pomona TaxID=44276 RepID=A0AA40WCS0_LEPIR|nr:MULTISPECIES: hypothetical protein [Leptospira]ASV06894.1 hypothetical protein B2G47_14540 [Leptospira interrogans serovar Canicola]ASV09276.1 hypothetical protein B2G50_11990 [Leptospira interrogans serovar Canicola]KGE25881.1 hypothetical protein IQ65_13295 [Leptospira interrogans serovar Lai]MBE8344490.1 hypothetical protein [Leptospira interrogans serovar Pomona]MBE8355522.1 hypothetical protein [Leptospira interrogans serovar Pomona]
MAGHSAECSIINHFYIGYTEHTLLFYNAPKTDFTDSTLIIEYFAHIIDAKILFQTIDLSKTNPFL